MPVHKGRENVEPDERYVMSRAEDRSLWIRAAYILEKYKVLVWLIGFTLVAIGFQFKTPGMIVSELQTQITSNKAMVDKIVIPRVDSLQSNITVLLKLQCIDSKLTPQQRALVGLNCKNLFGDGVP